MHSTASAGHGFPPAASPSLLSVGKSPFPSCSAVWKSVPQQQHLSLQRQQSQPPAAGTDATRAMPRTGWEGTAAGARLSKHPWFSCKSYLAPERGCLSLPPRRQIAQQNCHAVAPSCESFTLNIFCQESRNREDITEAGHGGCSHLMKLHLPGEDHQQVLSPGSPLTWIRF